MFLIFLMASVVVEGCTCQEKYPYCRDKWCCNHPSCGKGTSASGTDCGLTFGPACSRSYPQPRPVRDDEYCNWFGTAPSCGYEGKASECRKYLMDYRGQSSFGDGKRCRTGWKISCCKPKPVELPKCGTTPTGDIDLIGTFDEFTVEIISIGTLHVSDWGEHDKQDELLGRLCCGSNCAYYPEREAYQTFKAGTKSTSMKVKCRQGDQVTFNLVELDSVDDDSGLINLDSYSYDVLTPGSHMTVWIKMQGSQLFDAIGEKFWDWYEKIGGICVTDFLPFAGKAMKAARFSQRSIDKLNKVRNGIKKVDKMLKKCEKEATGTCSEAMEPLNDLWGTAKGCISGPPAEGFFYKMRYEFCGWDSVRGCSVCSSAGNTYSDWDCPPGTTCANAYSGSVTLASGFAMILAVVMYYYF